MLRDVFYYGNKPNVHPREKFAASIEDAREQCTTEHFWIINEYCDYRGFDWDFDFEFLPDEDVWAEKHNNVWPSQHQKDSGTWLCPKKISDTIIYRADVDVVIRKYDKNSNWSSLEFIDESTFDFSWHPDPTDPPYTYVFGTQWQKTGGPVYTVPGIHKKSAVKHVDTRVIRATRLPNKEAFTILDDIVVEDFDYSWHPDDTEEPYIYLFGNNLYPAEVMPTIQYVPKNIVRLSSGKPIGQTKYVNYVKATLGENRTNWKIYQAVDETKFDFCWVPNPKDPAYIYVWGNKYIDGTFSPTIEYHVPSATEKKYMSALVDVLPEWDKWLIPDNIDKTSFDFTWRPDPREPAFIYEFATQWHDRGGPKYIHQSIIRLVSGKPIGQIKYIHDIFAKTSKDKTNWIIPDNIDTTGFDFSWVPHPDDPPYIYQFGTQWQKTGGPKYISDGIVKLSNGKYLGDTKYIDVQQAKTFPDMNGWEVIDDNVITEFDYSWYPDETDEPFIYVFGNNLYPAEIMPTIQYVPKNATRLASGKAIGQVKYVNDIVATLGENYKHWVTPDNIDMDSFDYSWVPNPKDPPYIYEFGTQWQNTGGPVYIVDGATERKYIDIQKAKALPNMDYWEVIDNNVIADFDYSWHPNNTDEPYIYVFGNNQYPAEIMPTIQYVPESIPRLASGKSIGQIKYVNDIIAKLGENRTNWNIPDNIDTTGFDFSWVPPPHDETYIYQFGTQWQKTGGPQYILPSIVKLSTGKYLAPIKYVDIQKVKALPNKNNFEILDNNVIADFDYSWHPDNTDEEFIYVFGNNQYPAEIMPTIQYVPNNSVRLASGAAIGQIKYVNDIIATLGENKKHWDIPDNIDTTSFDFSWVPDPHDDKYVYQFGTQWQKTGGPKYILPSIVKLPTGKYLAPNKYIDIQTVKSLPNKDNWIIPDNIDTTDFDFSWHPDDTDEQYIYQFGTQWQQTGGPRYVAEGATEVKYIDIQKVKSLPNKDNWIIPDNIDTTGFDFSWHPNTEGRFIYQFGTQWQKTGGPKYIIEGATETKYVDIQKVKALPNKNNFEILNDNVIDEFDYSWHHDETDEPYVYMFGNNQYPAEIMPTIQYIPKDAVRLASGKAIGQIKYVNDIVAILGENKSNWLVPDNVDTSEFDFSWVPHPHDDTYIYQFGTQWQKTDGPKYILPNIVKLSTGKYLAPIKYVDGSKAKILPNENNWVIPDNIIDFDFSWHPDASEEPYIYIFGTQWQKTGGPQYVSPGVPRLASGKPIGQIKYVDTITAKKLPNKKHWTNPNNADVTTFDFSWHPDDTSPPTTYQFGTLLNKEDGPRYVHPGTMDDVVVYLERIELAVAEESIEIKESFPKYIITTTLEDLIEQHPNKLFWALNPNLDYSKFDFDWRPNIEQAQFVQVFGSSENSKTQTYLVNSAMWEKGFREFNWVEEQIKNQIDIFFVDRSNNESHARFEKLKQQFPNIQKTRYLNSWVDTINRCINRANNNLCWILNSELDYTDFNFEYYPNPWQMKMVHVFGTQWSHWGTTFMVNRETFAQDTKHIKIVEHLSNLNFVKDRKAKATNVLYDIVYITHGNVTYTSDKLAITYAGSYLKTFKNMLDKLPVKKEHYIWVCSSICNYKDFDFTYICDPFARDQLHVFPSERQQFGDTFLINVNKLRELIDTMTMMEEYGKINYNQHQRVKRLPAPVIVSEYDTHVASILTEFDFPYATFVTEDNKDMQVIDDEPMNLWSEETKNVIITSTGGTRIIVPKEAKDFVETQLYDYPYITKTAKLAKSNPMDIVFLSNGESCAEENYQHLLKVTEGLPNRVVRVDGINGRVQAYHAVAEASETPWALTVFAKLKVSQKFDWNWQPDRLQMPKHYIFHAKNPVNGLTYGHQAMIAYNKKLTLANEGYGLDFTMDDPNEVVSIISGIATFNTDAYSTWRTAFRECIKLKMSGTTESKERLDMWLTVGMGKFNEYSMEGAQHAVEYYEEVSGDFNKLKLSYEWDWLKEKYKSKYE